MSLPGRSSYPAPKGTPVYDIPNTPLEEVLYEAGRQNTEPKYRCWRHANGLYAAVVEAFDLDGTCRRAWISEPVFYCPHAAEEHAGAMVGDELFPMMVQAGNTFWDDCM